MQEKSSISKSTWWGWCLYDWANSAFATVILASLLPVYLEHIVPEAGASVPIFQEPISASVLWSYTVACSMFFVLTIAPYLGSLADKRGSHVYFLMFFCLVGASATCLLYLAQTGDYLYAATIFILANFCFATANIFYNAFLPILAREREIDRLSAYGFALGYIGGALCLLLVVVLIYLHAFFGLESKIVAIRTGFYLTGLWWALFGIPVYFALRNIRPAKRLTGLPSGLKGYFRVFSDIRGCKNLIYFLIAFLFYNDAIQTIITVSAIYARDVLEISQAAILGCLLMIQFVAMPGSLIFGKLSEHLGTKRSIIISLCVFMGVTIYAGFVDSNTEFFILGFCVALVLGGSQAASRSLFASMLPIGKTAELFGFYAMSSKFASIFGPFIFAFIAQMTDSTRYSILALNLFFLTGIVLLFKVDPEKGQREALKD